MSAANHETMHVEGGATSRCGRGVCRSRTQRASSCARPRRCHSSFKHIAVMPDVHLGKGSTVGSVIPTLSAIIPAAVGVDIGCGMIAAKTTLTRGRPARQPERCVRQSSVRCRMAERPGKRDKGAWGDSPPANAADAWASLDADFERDQREASAPEEHEQPRAPGNARHRQPLRRGLPRRGPGRLVHAPQRFARRRQRHRHALHRAGEAGHAPVDDQPARPGSRVLSGRHASTSTTTSKRWSGRRTSRG